MRRSPLSYFVVRSVKPPKAQTVAVLGLFGIEVNLTLTERFGCIGIHISLVADVEDELGAGAVAVAIAPRVITCGSVNM